MLPWYFYPAACCALAGGACGWVLGYAHRDLIEWGRRCGRLLAWWRKHRMRNPLGRPASAYRELWADIVHLCATGELRPGRLAVQQEAPGGNSGGLFWRPGLTPPCPLRAFWCRPIAAARQA